MENPSGASLNAVPVDRIDARSGCRDQHRTSAAFRQALQWEMILEVPTKGVSCHGFEGARCGSSVWRKQKPP
jgi:hypothetical protein